jgi:hypothetical protein
MSPDHRQGHGLVLGLNQSLVFEVLTYRRLSEPSLHTHELLLLTGLVFRSGLTR